MTDSVRVETRERVTTVILDRPEVRNAVDSDTADSLAAAFRAFDEDDRADVAVFWGANGVFCAGGDLKHVVETDGERWLNERPFPSDGTEAPSTAIMGPVRLELDKPVIAAISGPAVAGGLELALWCDIRVMEEDAYFGVFSRRWGVPLIDGGTVRLPRLVGQGRALDIILTGRTVGAREALAIGMCEHVVPRGQARAAAESLARGIARFPQGAAQADRRSVRRQFGLPVHEALRQEFEQGLDAMRTEGVPGARRFAGGQGRHGDFSGL